MIKSLDVMLWGRKVGTLIASKKGYAEQVCFYFDHAYVRGGVDIAPLMAPLSGIVANTGLPVYPESAKEYGGLPSFIADSLPDHWGNTLFSEWARRRGIRSRDLSPLDRLAYIGSRGMGALEFVPSSSPELETPFKVEISELASLAQMAVAEAKKFHAVMSPDFMIESLFRVGTSAGGRRPKAVINVNPESGECYSGQVHAPLPGFVPMLIKFDEHADVPSTRIEYSYYLMALDAGLEMTSSRLVEGERAAHFLTTRFDRRGEEKVHVQTLAAMNPLASSYEDLLDVARRLDVSSEERRRLFLQMVMNVLGGNVDDHTKNFSFLMGRDAKWHIAPTYDYTFTVDLSAPFYVNRHSLSVDGKVEEISRRDLLELAARHDIKDAQGLIDRAVDAITRYPQFAVQAGVPAEWITLIQSEQNRRLSALH